MTEKQVEEKVCLLDTLDAKQRLVFDAVKESDKNICVFGWWWVWKSHLINTIVQESWKKVKTLAPTWIAAINIHGETIHSFFGIRKSNFDLLDEDIEIIKSFDTFIFDEGSMIRSDLMDLTNEVLQYVFQTNEPFGWKQIIIIWDLYQLPPIVTKDDKDYKKLWYITPFFFGADCFNVSDFKFFELTKVFRQSDVEFIWMLNGFRKWTHDDMDLYKINKRYTNKVNEKAIMITTTNKISDEKNTKELNILEWKEKIYHGSCTTGFPEKMYPTALSLGLKIGARVMTLMNANSYKNGSLWEVVSMKDEFIMVKFDDWHTASVMISKWEEIIKGKAQVFTQLPIKLAWSISIHKSQWQSFDEVVVDMGRWAFADGQTYVALSRAKSLEWLQLKSFIKPSDIRVNKDVKRFLAAINNLIK